MNYEKCPICEYSLEEETTFCPLCGSEFTGSTTEEKVREAQGTYTLVDKRYGGSGTGAKMFLTNQRFIAIPTKMEGYNLSGALTAAVINKMRKKFGVISIPLKEIKAVRDGKFGLLAKAIIIDTTDGQLVKITVAKQKEWKELLTDIVSR